MGPPGHGHHLVAQFPKGGFIGYRNLWRGVETGRIHVVSQDHRRQRGRGVKGAVLRASISSTS